MSTRLENHFKGKRWENPRGERIEGVHVPLTLWRCLCGRRFRGDGPVNAHLSRSRHFSAEGLIHMARSLPR